MQVQHGVISLLADDDVPGITVGAGWNEGTDERYRARLPVRVVGQIVASTIPVAAESVAHHPLFSAAEAALPGATEDTAVSFIGTLTSGR